MTRAEFGVLVVDDEPAARRGVRQLLSAFPEFAVVGECRNGVEALTALDALKVHLVFLDVQMPGIDGFEVIRRRTPERMPAVVFLTAYDQFAIKAFDAEALDYLVKPVSESRFAATIRRVTRRLRAPGAAGREPSIVVSTARGAAVVPVAEIEWIEAADNYVRLWTGGRSHLVRESIGSLEGQVGASGFRRAHRRALVRVDAVRELVRAASGDLTAVLASGARVPVSRRRRAGFVKAVKRPR